MDHFRCFARNRRWGTCAACPRDSQGHAYPEFCQYTKRYDHQYTARILATVYEKSKESDAKPRQE